MKFVLVPGFDNKMRMSDPLGLLGSDLFTEDDIKDEKYRPLLISAVNHLRNSNMKEAILLKDTILKLHKKYLDTELQIQNNEVLDNDTVIKIKQDKKYAALLAIFLCMTLSVNFNVTFNFDVDLNELWDQIILLVETHNVDELPTNKK
ncbi:MAG: hypothetical protein AB2809_00310 [Candidatus Thiodiazotropha sp.]